MIHRRVQFIMTHQNTTGFNDREEKTYSDFYKCYISLTTKQAYKLTFINPPFGSPGFINHMGCEKRLTINSSDRSLTLQWVIQDLCHYLNQTWRKKTYPWLEGEGGAGFDSSVTS